MPGQPAFASATASAAPPPPFLKLWLVWLHGHRESSALRFSAATTADRLLPQGLADRARPLMDKVDALLFSSGDRAQAGRVSIIAFAIRIMSAVIAFASQVLLARWMGSFEYGIFVLVWVTMVILGNLSCLGFHTSIIRFIPEYRERGELDELRGVMLASRVFVLVASTLIAMVSAALVLSFADRIESYYVVPFLIGILCLPMIALSDVVQGISRANAWAISALSPTYIVRPVLIMVFMLLGVALGYAANAETALLAAVAATYATTIWQLATVTTRAERGVAKGPRVTDLRGWIAISLPIFLIEGFAFMLTNADVLMVGVFLSPHDVAIYYAMAKTLALVHFVYFAVKAGVASRYAQFTHGGARDRLAEFARETVSWTFWPSLAMALFVLAIGRPMLGLFGPGFEEGYPYLFVLVVGVVARASVGPAESLLTMSGNQNVCAMVYGMTLAFNVALNVVLIPQIGLWGAALATALAMMFEATALSLTAWRRLGIVMFVFAPRHPVQEPS
jgi:O-antigen/teichoic acid export membrane protein